MAGRSPWLRMRLFGISPDEVTFARRGFQSTTPEAQAHLENIGTTFLIGYHLALEHDASDALAKQLHEVEPTFQGFAFEGAAMALALLDQLVPWKKGRIQAFLAGAGDTHAYMVHVGLGWSWARLHRRVERQLPKLDPILRWLALDGYGFHEGYFYWRRSVRQQVVPRSLKGYARRAFDQGLGRSLWFVDGTDVERIVQTIATFPPSRQPDLWSGLGLACTYAGGVDEAALTALQQSIGDFLPYLAQGAAFAAKARQRAGNMTPHTEAACTLLCGLSAHEAALLTDEALLDLPSDAEQPAFEVWRQRIQAHFVQEMALSP